MIVASIQKTNPELRKIMEYRGNCVDAQSDSCARRIAPSVIASMLLIMVGLSFLWSRGKMVGFSFLFMVG
jgi:hypothetical protein